MEIEYKGIEHERTEDAPFIGALIIAMDCTFNCTGCCNHWLTDIEQPYFVNTESEIISKVKENPFNEGIILAGLEWSLQPMEMLSIASEASKAGLEVMIYTGLDKTEFLISLGKACAKNVGQFDALQSNVHRPEDRGVFAFIASMMLDEMVGNFYLKCGKYDETNLVTDRVQFGVKLASSNQNIYKFEKVEDIKDGQT